MESSPGVDHGIVVDAVDFTQRSLLIWHTLFGVMVAAAAILTTADGYGAWTLPLLLVLVVAYVVIGLPAGRREDRREVRRNHRHQEEVRHSHHRQAAFRHPEARNRPRRE